MKISGLRVIINICKAFGINYDKRARKNEMKNCGWPNAYDEIGVPLTHLYYEDFITYFPRILIELILTNNDNSDAWMFYEEIHVNSGDFYEYYKANYLHKDTTMRVDYEHERQRKYEELYSDLTVAQCAAVRDWLAYAADNFETGLDDLAIVDAYLYWDKRSMGNILGREAHH